MPGTYLKSNYGSGTSGPPLQDIERLPANGGFHSATLVSGCNAPDAAERQRRPLFIATNRTEQAVRIGPVLALPRHACHRRHPAFARRVHRDAWAPAHETAGPAALHGRRINIRVGTARAGERRVPQTDAGRKLWANRSRDERAERSTGWRTRPDHALSVAADSVSCRPGQRQRYTR